MYYTKASSSSSSYRPHNTRAQMCYSGGGGIYKNIYISGDTIIKQDGNKMTSTKQQQHGGLAGGLACSFIWGGLVGNGRMGDVSS